MSTYVERLARFAADVFSGAIVIPDDVRERARHIILDSCGAIIGAQSLPEIKALGTGLANRDNSFESLILLGTAGVSLELDEGCAASRGHPGMHVIPAALEAAARRRATGEVLLRAVVAGYEIAARLGAATLFRDGIHPHGTWGGAGGAVAVGLLEGLNDDRLAQAIRIASSLAIATHYEAVREGASARNLWSGLGNAVSLLAARASAAGFTGAASAPAHVFGATLGVAFDEHVAGRGLGEDWYMRRNYFKLYACCRHAHASVDAFRSIVDGSNITAGKISAVSVTTYARAVDAVGRNYRPETPLGAKFSLPYMFSVYLETASLGPEAFEAPYLGAERFHAIADRVTVAEDPNYTAMLPSTRAARVKVRLNDGSERTAEAMGSRGDPHDPLTSADIEAKFLNLTAGRMGKRADALMSSILRIDESEDVRHVFDALIPSLHEHAGEHP